MSARTNGGQRSSVDILSEVCRSHGFSLDTLRSAVRSHRLSLARAEAAYRLRNEGGYRPVVIAELLNRRSLGTITEMVRTHRLELLYPGRSDGVGQGPVSEENMAGDALKPSEAIKQRCCLMCRETFPSHHVGERVCPACRKSPEWKSGDDDGWHIAAHHGAGTWS